MEIYCVKDVFTGFADPVCFVNRALAIDSFRSLCRELPSLDFVPYKVSDISLYVVGSFDNCSGVITPVVPTLVVEGSNFLSKDGDDDVQDVQASETD